MSDTLENILALGGSLKQREQIAVWPLSTPVVEGVRGLMPKAGEKRCSKQVLETTGA